MGGPARPLHEPGNHRSSERCSPRQSADCGSLTIPASPAAAHETSAALTPLLGARSSHAEKGLTRSPPNVVQISVEREATRTWLIARRNDVVLRFPLREEDCEHLARLLRER